MVNGFWIPRLIYHFRPGQPTLTRTRGSAGGGGGTQSLFVKTRENPFSQFPFETHSPRIGHGIKDVLVSSRITTKSLKSLCLTDRKPIHQVIKGSVSVL